MATQYRCGSEQRRTAVRTTRGADALPLLNGIDYLEVAPDQKTLHVCFIHPLPGAAGAVPAPPAGPLGKQNIRIEGGVRITPIAVRAISTAGNVLMVEVEQPGDFSTYTLRLVTSPTDPAPPTGYDRQLAELAFSFKVDCPSDFDCRQPDVCPPTQATDPQLDYLAKDYASFRRLMLDRMAVIMPGWRERNPADLQIALVELLAYAGDYLSYHQDAVATEAYLGTARRRVSVRRHARMLDYPMHDGCNARAWIWIEVGKDSSADGWELPARSPFLTKSNAPAGPLDPDDVARASGPDTLVFESMHPLTLRAAHNTIELYTWGDLDCCLPRGATAATLDDTGRALELRVGDVLIFEEVRGPNGVAADASLAQRHAVRLTSVVAGEDPLFFEDEARTHPQRVVEIRWAAEDALPFPLCLRRFELDPGSGRTEPCSVARGNIVLADHGATIAEELLPAVPIAGRYRPRLQGSHPTQRAPYDHEQARRAPAAAALSQTASAALPDIEVREAGATWLPARDLLACDRFTRAFVVEVEDDGRAALRFGDDVLGRRPAGGSALRATYRTGGGPLGNVGAGAISHLVTRQRGILAVRNPLAARGGSAPESLEQVRLYAPQAFKTQERVVSEADYAAAAERHPEVQRAVGTLRWTGSWYTMFITVDRRAGLPVDAAFEEELRRFLERFRMAGQDLEIDGPRLVPLDIALTVCVKPGYLRGAVRQALLQAFSARDLAGGRGFFHPDNFTFGQPVYLSQIIATAMQVPGVEWIDSDDSNAKPNRFRRWGEPARGELSAGLIKLGRLEIARLDNDPNAPEHGKLDFMMTGGL